MLLDPPSPAVMGQYYSLNPAVAVPHWSRATLDAIEDVQSAGQAAPSIWTGVPFNPLLQSRQFLLERTQPGGEAPLISKWGMQIRAPAQNFEVEIARSSEVYVLVVCDVESSHMYAAILFSGEWERHAYWRVGAQTALDPTSNMHFPHGEKVRAQMAHEKRMAQTGGFGTGRQRMYQRSRLGTHQAAALAVGNPGAVSQFEAPSSQPQPRKTRARSPSPTASIGEEQRSALLQNDREAQARSMKRSVSGPQLFDGLTAKTRAAWGSVFDNDQWMKTNWEHFMLYNVQEGILGHFGASLDACAEAMAAVVASSGRRPSLCLAHRVGTIAMTRDLVTTLNADLRRSFKIKTEDHMLRQSTNCVQFTMRVLKSLNLPLRGHQLQEAAEQQAGIGQGAGEVLAQGWEYLWNRVDP